MAAGQKMMARLIASWRRRCATYATAMTVFPSPMSRAHRPLPRSSNHFTPSRWKG
ncbi:MAG: hypothetical protein QW795_06345 [Candidatus Bathyarchaeia archaeon]